MRRIRARILARRSHRLEVARARIALLRSMLASMHVTRRIRGSWDGSPGAIVYDIQLFQSETRLMGAELGQVYVA